MSTNLLATVLASLTLGSSAHAVIVSFNNVNVTIPDGNPGGILHSQTVSGLNMVSITDLNVWLDIETLPGGTGPMYNGDLYVGLSYGTGFSVLLSRVGRGDVNSTGYGDSGFGNGFVLDDQAAQDVHTYRNSTGVLNAPLTGSWQPSGRSDGSVTPGSEVTTTIRLSSAMLSTFNGMNPNGEWTLFLMDMETGGQAQLKSWSLEFQGVPEPESYAVITSFALGLGAVIRHCRRPRGAKS